MVLRVVHRVVHGLCTSCTSCYRAVMPAWLLVALAILATMRLTRLVTADKITEPIREALIRRWGEDAKRSYLITCDYCASMYVAPFVAAAVVLWPTNRVILIALIALAASFVAGIVAAHE